MREGRAFGLGVVIASQFPTDLPTSVAGSTATKLYFSQTNVEQIRDIQRTVLGKTSGTDADHLASIIRGLPPLTCVLYSKQFPRFVRVTINPYFERYG
jgi:DNA helicase HerA-like ATPase